MSKSPINKSFNGAADQSKVNPMTVNPTAPSNSKKAPVPQLQLNPPASQKSVNTQIMLDNIAAKRSPLQVTQQKKAVPPAKQEFAKAKVSGQAVNDFNKTSNAKAQNQGVQQNNMSSSLKQEFAKAKASDKAVQGFNLAAKTQHTRGMSK